MDQLLTMPEPQSSEDYSPEETKSARRQSRRRGLFAPDLMKAALKQSFVMLRPDIQWKNPVMFVVEVGTVLTIVFTFAAMLGYPSQARRRLFDRPRRLAVPDGAVRQLRLGPGRGARQGPGRRAAQDPASDAGLSLLNADGIGSKRPFRPTLQAGDRVVVEAGQIIPGDGEIVEGVASVDESAITGESAPVIREAGGDRSGVTGGTRVLSDRIVVDITASAGKSFLDRMIALVEGAIRQRTPNEIALSLVLSAFTLIFLIVTAALWPMALNAELYMKDLLGIDQPLKSLGTDVPTLVALLVCLIPTTIGALLAAIGIAGMDRALRANIIAKSGKAVEVAGDVDTLLLDKTGTITIGNRKATQFVPFDGFSASDVGHLAALASAADQTPEGKSIVELFHQIDDVNGGNGNGAVPPGAQFRRVHGPDAHERRRSARWPANPQGRSRTSIIRHVRKQNGTVPTAHAETSRRRRRRQGRHAAAGLRRQPHRRPGRAGRHSQAGHRRALRAPAPHGPAHRHGHR